MKRFLARGAAIAAFTLQALTAHAAALPGPLVDSQWLADHLADVQVVDVRGSAKSWTAAPEVETDAKTGKRKLVEVGGHIAGARLLEMGKLRGERQIAGQTVKYMIPEQAVFEKTVQAAGIDAGKPIVLVSTGTSAETMDEALRAYWQFKVFGDDQVAVLNGGMADWLVAGRPVTTEAGASRTGTWVATADHSARYFASSDDVAKAAAAHSATLVDARDSQQYHGLSKRDYVFGYGHIEGAKQYAPDLMTKTEGGAVKLLSPATYRALMTAQGIDPSAPAITYCNSGHLAAGPWFVLSEVLKNPNARLYDGSMHEWTLEKRPLAGAVPLQ
ncbi:MAG: sulfurtransferase [Burkholderiaceae bacterium]|uniref:sulfurtransferase n=1 Tax=Ottowia sp. TaxID=1898956 RepID=UPI002D107CE9|nr:rhodanese-like domain-containing protein [Ottowia sp.]MCP5257402.1 sulfurtransferase [Burkholderiaceae bacterium]HRW71097.1 rhodanese-like domain-containing protein [Ottowia sp.]